MVRKKLMHHVSCWLMAGALLVMCSAGVLAAGSPRIDWLYADKTESNASEKVTLYYETTNVKFVTINRVNPRGEKTLDETLPLDGTYEVLPKVTSTYVLTAYGYDDTAVSKSITINVGANGTSNAVKIEYFNTSQTQVLPNEAVTLSWKTLNGQSVRIYDRDGKDVGLGFQLQGSTDIYPERTTSYVLQVTGMDGKVISESVTVNVDQTKNKPQILTFKADKRIISKGETVKFSWTSENVEKCTLMGDDKILADRYPANGSFSLTIDKTTKFMLYGYDAKGNIVASSAGIVIVE